MTSSKRLCTIGLLAAQLFTLPCANAFAQGIGTPEVTITGKKLRIASAGGNQIITLKHVVQRDDINFEDLDFDGYSDLKVLSSRGATQEFYDVYLYKTSTRKFTYSEQLSRVPCVQADAKRRQVVGACFHESACENWSERYSISKSGKLSLSERDGTYCNAATGETFAYVDRFMNGKRISSQVKPINDEKASQ